MLVGNFGDLHLTDDKPKSRLEPDFFAVQLGKLTYAMEQMIAKGCKVITFSGDIFDKPRVSNRVLTEFGNLLADAKTRGVTFITTLGQHDITHYNYARWRETSDVAVLSGLGYLNVLVSGESLRVDDVMFYGYGIKENACEDFLEGRTPFDPVTASRSVALVHAMVCDEANDFGVRAISDLNIKTVKWACFGDIHKGFEPHQFKNALKTVAFSCGTMTRMKTSEGDIAPCFAIIDIDGNSLEFFDIPHSDPEFTFKEPPVRMIANVSQDFNARLTEARTRKKETNEEVMMRVAKLLAEEEDEDSRLVLSEEDLQVGRVYLSKAVG